MTGLHGRRRARTACSLDPTFTWRTWKRSLRTSRAWAWRRCTCRRCSRHGRQHARLRHRRPSRAQSGARNRGGPGAHVARRRSARPAIAGRHRAQPHGRRSAGQSVVARGARERPVLAVRASTSTSTGTRSRRSCGRRSCCRFSVTSTAPCSIAASYSWSTTMAGCGCATSTMLCRSIPGRRHSCFGTQSRR